MHFVRTLQVAALVLSFAGIPAPAGAMTANFATLAVASNRLEVQSTCHHYRWSSRRHCTSSKALRFSAKPRLHYPHRYFGGTPHYEYAFPYYYGYRAPYFGQYGFYRYPWYRRPYWY
jgi:hypothetical protein